MDIKDIQEGIQSAGSLQDLIDRHTVSGKEVEGMREVLHKQIDLLRDTAVRAKQIAAEITQTADVVIGFAESLKVIQNLQGLLKADEDKQFQSNPRRKK